MIAVDVGMVTVALSNVVDPVAPNAVAALVY
jgi:hypothetical protein